MSPQKKKNGTLFRNLLSTMLIIGFLPIIIFLIHLFFNIESIGYKNIIIYGVLLFIAEASLSYIIALKLSQRVTRPMSQLAEGATEIARGNFQHRIKIDEKGEIGKVAKLFNYMTTEVQRLHDMNLNEIIVEKTKTKTIIRNVADGVIVTDLDKNILVLNSVAEKWFNVHETEAVNNPIDQFIKNKELLSLIDKVVARENGTEPVEIPIKFAGQTKQSFLAAKSARVALEDGGILGIATILRDITREKEIDRMKTELVSMVAHELRSPLTSVSGFSELLLDKDTTKEQAEEYASIILKESNRLSDLINKFLDISKIESGKSQAQKSVMNLSDTIEIVTSTNMHIAERKGIRVNVDVQEDLGTVYADPAMMDQVVLNLFSNAIKYSPENSEVKIKAKENNDTIEISVIDQGYGIPKESLPKIFKKFYRVTEHEKVREITGSGLGLSLVREILEIHGGSIKVSSRLGKGSTFTFTLPLSDNQINHSIDQKEEETAGVT